LREEIKTILLISIFEMEHPSKNNYDKVLDILKEKAEKYKVYMD
jgi:hypothetical protein